MTESHTADLATRYRYRTEGRELEQARIVRLLDLVRRIEKRHNHGATEEKLAWLIELIEMSPDQAIDEIKGKSNV